MTKPNDNVVLGNFKQGFQESNSEFNGGGNGGGGDMKEYITKEELRRELDHLETRIDNKFLELQLSLKDQQTSNIRWMIATALTLAGVIIAAIKLF